MVPEKWENNPALLTPQITNFSRHWTSSTPRLPTSSTTAAGQQQSPTERLHVLLGGACGSHPALPLPWHCRGLADHFGSPFIPFLQPPASSGAQCSAPRWDDLELNSGRWWGEITPLKFMPQECLLTVFWHQNKKEKKIPTLWFSCFWRETQPNSVSRIKPKDQPSSDKLYIDFMLNS